MVKLAFQPCTLGKKRNVSVKYINLLPFLVDKGNAAPAVKAQMTVQPPITANTVIMASLVFCARDSISIL